MGILYVVATPIGNMGDMTPRAIEILSQVSLVAAEDTRVSGMLLDRFGIKKPLVSYHKFNEKEKSSDIIDKLLGDDFDVAIVTDAGTPCISDPGSVLVKEAYEAGVKVVGIPGASAVTLALSISGFDTLDFAFYGFFPRNKKEQSEFCERIKGDTLRCAVFYESPKRIEKTLNILSEFFYDDEICLCNDLTKKFERVYRGKVQDVLEQLSQNEKSDLGEYAIVLQKREVETKKDIVSNQDLSLEARIFDLFIQGKTIKESVEKLTKEGFNRNDAYSAGLNVKKYLK